MKNKSRKQLIAAFFVLLFFLSTSTVVKAGDASGQDYSRILVKDVCRSDNVELGSQYFYQCVKGKSYSARSLRNVNYDGYTWISDTSVTNLQANSVTLYNYYVRTSSGGSGGGTTPTTPSSYTVTVKDCIDSQSGYVLGSGTYTVSAGSSAYATALRSTTYSGYRLLEGTYSNSVSSNITLYRIFNRISTYAVSYNGNGSTSGSMPNDTFEVGQTKRLSPNAYSKEYTVSFNTDGGENINPKTLSYEFKGWALSPNGEVVYEDNQEVSNLTTTDGATTSN